MLAPSDHQQLRTDMVSAAPPRPTPDPQRPEKAATPSVGPSTVAQEETWATVVRKGKSKGKGRGKKKSSTPAPTSATQKVKPAGKTTAAPSAKPAVKPTATPSKPSGRPAVKATAKRNLKAPKTAAVVVQLQPEAAERGLTYGSILRTAQDKVNPQELGIDRIRFRQTATGARMLEIPGSEKDEKADQLASRLREALVDVATVSRPVKSVQVRISGLDDTATPERVAAAVAKAASIDVGAVRAGTIRPGFGGTGSVVVSCPIPAAKVLTEGGRLLIGWSSVRVVALEALPMRCYRCMGLGHTRPLCPSSVDRGELCFRCGRAGHKAAACEEATPRCAICAETGRPSDHRMGGRRCKPATTKGKTAGARATPAPTSQASEAVSLVADGEVVMSD